MTESKTKMEKICFITTAHSAFDTRIFHKEARTLAAAGYEVVLIAPNGKNEMAAGIKIMALPKPKNRFHRMFFLCRLACRLAVRQNADVYHFHDPELLFWMLGVKAKTKAKVVYDAHENVSQDVVSRKWIPQILRKPVSTAFGFFEKTASKKIDFVICANDAIKKTFQNKGVKNSETVVNFPIMANFLEKSHGRKGGPARLIYVGSLSEEYGIRQITKAAKMLKDRARLTLVGGFDDLLLEKEIKGNNDCGIEFTGRIRHKEVFSYLRDADVGLICFGSSVSYLETGFGSNKLFEYMGAGLPVIASDYPVLKKIIEGCGCGICVDSSDPGRIAQAAEYLISHKDESRKMGENGRQAVIQKYNWERESRVLLDAYKKICAA